MKRINWWYILIAGMLLVIVFFIVDCSVGEVHYSESHVNGHKHIAAWTETYTTIENIEVDNELIPTVQVHTIYHPDEWHIYALSDHSGYQFDIDNYNDYLNFSDGAAVFVRYRKGRWTHLRYLASVENIPHTEK